MNLRLARPSESEELSALAITAKALWGYSPQQLAGWANQLRISQESIATVPTFVVEEHGRLVGVAQLSQESTRWAIECLWVHPSSIRRGVGKRLLQHVLAYARSHGQTELRVDADPNAEAFYLRLGARRVGEVAAPVLGQPRRIRPQLVVSTENAA